MARQCAVLQLWGQELEAAGSGGYSLPDQQSLVSPVRPLVIPPYVHGVAVWPLLGGEGAGVSLTIRQRVMWGRERMGMAPFALPGIQGVW